MPKANCLLISANRVTAPYPVYPLGIAHLKAAMEKHGHTVHHYDVLAAGGLEPLEELLKTDNFDVIGISIRNIDTVDSAAPTGLLPDIEAAIHKVRQQSQAPIVLGGPGFSIMPEELLQYLKADYGVVGEGEQMMPVLINKILSNQPVDQKLYYAERNSTDWQQPVFSRDISSYYISHGGMLNIQTKRGCPHRCSYCSYPTIEGRQMRYTDPAETAGEVQRLVKEQGARYIFFTDSVFNDPGGHYLKVAEALIKNNNKTPWCAFFRPQGLGRSELRLLKQSGLHAMELGTDGATDETMAALNKGFTFSEVLAINKIAVDEAIPCAHFIMFGGPEETEDTVIQGLKNIEQLEKSVVFAFVGIRILPQTEIYNRALADGIIDRQQPLLEPVFYYSPAISRQRIDTLLSKGFHGRMDRIYPCAHMEKQIGKLHKMGHDGPLWDALIRHLLKPRV